MPRPFPPVRQFTDEQKIDNLMALDAFMNGKPIQLKSRYHPAFKEWATPDPHNFMLGPMSIPGVFDFRRFDYRPKPETSTETPS